MTDDRGPLCVVGTRGTARRRVEPGTPLSIGRHADVILSNDPYLHRRAVEITVFDDHVELANVGSSLRVTLVHERTRSVTQLEPGGRCALFEGRTTMSIRTVDREHELEISVRLPGVRAPETREVPAVVPGKDTRRPRTLTDDQRLLLVALAEPLLLDPTRTLADLPSNREVADRLGIGAGFNGRLDRLCAAVAKLGVDGLGPVVSDDPFLDDLDADRPRKNRRRRERLVEWALENNVVTFDDLDRLDGPGGR